MSAKSDLIDHLQTGATTTCRAWMVERTDGVTLCFTDHDTDLEFDGKTFKADSGLTAAALQSSTGLSVDNTEVIGALQDTAITEEDVRAGRFSNASVTTWMVNWVDPGQRMIRFKGTIGEIVQSGNQFTAELRGLTEALNRKSQRLYQPNCSAILGDNECKFDVAHAGFSFETTILETREGAAFLMVNDPFFADEWFQRGKATVTSGRAKGLVAMVKQDVQQDDGRLVRMWVDFNLQPEAGDTILLVAGCDKQADTCRTKFSNFLNFRGFPHIPSADWMASYPVSTQRNDGTSRFK